MNLLRKIYRVSEKNILKVFGLHLGNYRNNLVTDHTETVDFLMSLRVEGRVFQSFEELMNVYGLAKTTSALEGDIAEVGVFKGGTAKVLALSKGSRLIRLFDSFEGMRATSSYDGHRPGDFSDTSLESVQQYLHGIQGIHFYKGWFPETTRGLEETKYSFVHLDVDLYQSTLDALLFFYPRLVSGGMILSHDFNSRTCPGVSKAYKDFFSDKPEAVIELSGTTQCLIVKK